MIRCEHCNLLTKSGEKPVRVVLEKRAATYPFIADAHEVIREGGRRERRNDPGGQGWQIVREALMHRDCAKEVDDGRAGS